MKNIIKSAAPHLASLLAFIIFASIYFYPAYQGKSLQGEDVVGSFGQTREKKDAEYFENTIVLWNGTIFSGMPNLVFAKFKGASHLNYIYSLPRRLGMPHEVSSLLWYMIGFYILLLTLGVRPLVAAGGSMAYALSTYYVIIILAGHYMKVDTLALIPPTLAGILLVFRGKYLWGFILTAFFLAFQINMAHIQMMYYFLISLIILGLFQFYFHLKEKKIKEFALAVLVLIGAGLLGVAPNMGKLVTYYKYNDFSIRGKSELTLEKDPNKSSSKGLDKDYINMWSSGVDEAMMVIVPNVKGGATALVGQDRDLLKNVPPAYRETIGNMNQYWGNQPFSGGPNYLGIIFVFFFFLGMFLLPWRTKFAALATFVLFLLLSMGGNLSAFTDLFIYYIPMYNKFRTPVSILAVAAIWVGLVAIYTLYQIYANPKLLQKEVKLPGLNKNFPAYLVTAGIFTIFLLINLLFPHLFNSYLSNAELNQLNSLRNQPNLTNRINELIQVMVDFRVGVFKADLFRSLIFVLLATFALFLYSKGKLKANILAGAIVVLAIIDFWGVSRRYVPLERFTPKGSQVKAAHQLSETDRQIYQFEMAENPAITDSIKVLEEKYKPTTPEEKDRILTYAVNKYSHYRVFNLAGNPFNENITASAHRSVGGYHAVKLRSYQDIIDVHLSKMSQPVLNMLNTKYLITKNGLQRNAGAMGAAWFVDSLAWVSSANDEIMALSNLDLRHTAVIRDKYKSLISDLSSANDKDTISLDHYSPDHLIYKAKTTGKRVAIFSEVYFPDWKVSIDGQPADLFPANYILRGVVIPEGEHTIEFVFRPEYYYTWNNLAEIAFYVLVLILLLTFLWEGYKNKAKIRPLTSKE